MYVFPPYAASIVSTRSRSTTPQRAPRPGADGTPSSSSASSRAQDDERREEAKREEKNQAHEDRQDGALVPEDAPVREVIGEARIGSALPPAPEGAHANRVLPPAHMLVARFVDMPPPDAERWQLLTDCDPEFDIESIGCHAKSEPRQRTHLLKLISNARGREAEASVIKDFVAEFYKTHLTPHAIRAAAAAFRPRRAAAHRKWPTQASFCAGDLAGSGECARRHTRPPPLLVQPRQGSSGWRRC